MDESRRSHNEIDVPKYRMVFTNFLLLPYDILKWASAFY
jgi:hypothetical protein